MNVQAMRASWCGALAGFGLAASEQPIVQEWWDTIVARYGEPWRAYHTLHHVSDMWRNVRSG